MGRVGVCVNSQLAKHMLEVYLLLFYDLSGCSNPTARRAELLSTLDDHFITNINKIALLNISAERKVLISDFVTKHPLLEDIRRAYQNSKFLGSILSIFKEFFEFVGILNNTKTQKKKQNYNLKSHFAFLFFRSALLHRKVNLVLHALSLF